LLVQTLRSVLWQRDVHLEVIVVDEGSTDDTLEAIAAFGDLRVHVIRNDAPSGVARARNRGVADARGQWLAFIDDDDLWAPDKLRLQLEEADAGGRDWVYGGAVIIDPDGRIMRAQPAMPVEATLAALRRYDAIPGGASNVILKRSAWQQIGPFDIRLANTEDWELYIRLATLTPPACVQRPLVARRLHFTNAVLDTEELVRGIRLIEATHGIRADWGLLRRWMAHSCLRSGHRRAALGQFVMAARAGAWRGVAGDLGSIAAETVRRYVRGPRPRQPQGRDAWIAEADSWLDGIRRSTAGTTPQ
jgi:glycosyltransferase involved in cell wall biosynthesis